MKKTLTLAVVAIAAVALPISAHDTPAPQGAPVKVDAKVEKMIREALPYCADSKLTFTAMPHPLPANLTGTIVTVESTSHSCHGQYLNVVSKEGGFFLGIPWFLDEEKGTLEEKIKNFTWSRLQAVFDPVVEKTKTRDGLYKVSLNQTTERGKLPLEAEIDPAGKVIFLGRFRALSDDVRAARLKTFEPFIANSPATGGEKPAVTIVEFSDFECPSCKAAAGYLTPILTKFGDKVRYVRYDLPLLGNHPWALAASVAGRAIYRQKPEAFWEYKKQIYSNQDQLSAFTIGDFARGFAEDHELDLAKYDKDVESAEIRNELIKAAAVALSNDIRATPSYLVNGTIVDAGADGKDLEAYVAGLLK